jgi:phage FluMu protein Com
MQIRCYQCHKPFAIGKAEVHAALDLLVQQEMGHYNAQCPHCRRVNRVSRDELMRSAPDWTPTANVAESNTE